MEIVFDWIQPIRKASARKFDPQTSHDAAARVELGKADQQRQAIFDLLKTRGPMTVRMMEEHLPWTAHELGKRIGEVQGIMPTGEVRDGMRVWGLV